MKIKHYAGYGSVNAKVMEKSTNRYVIDVQGMHECGLVPYCESDSVEWLLKKHFAKNESFGYREWLVSIDHISFDHVVYTFVRNWH